MLRAGCDSDAHGKAAGSVAHVASIVHFATEPTRGPCQRLPVDGHLGAMRPDEGSWSPVDGAPLDWRGTSLAGPGTTSPPGTGMAYGGSGSSLSPRWPFCWR